MITWSETREIDIQQLLQLYNDAGWSVYTRDPAQLQRGVANSWHVVTAWEGEVLIGLTRCLSDGETIAYIQDILVKKSYQGQGVGSELMSRLLTKIGPLRQIALMTDSSEKNQAVLAWYACHGFTSYADLEVAGFAIFNFPSGN